MSIVIPEEWRTHTAHSGCERPRVSLRSMRQRPVPFPTCHIVSQPPALLNSLRNGLEIRMAINIDLWYRCLTRIRCLAGRGGKLSWSCDLATCPLCWSAPSPLFYAHKGEGPHAAVNLLPSSDHDEKNLLPRPPPTSQRGKHHPNSCYHFAWTSKCLRL